MLRILQHGLLDGSGKRSDPSLVRIGVNVHHSVKHVSLESLVDAKLGVGEKVGSPARPQVWHQTLNEAIDVISLLQLLSKPTEWPGALI